MGERPRRRPRHLDRAGRRGTGRPAHRRAGRHRRVVAVPARRARRPLPPDRLRQPGRGRGPHARGPVSVERMADDAAGVLRALGILGPRRRLFGGSIIAQELALRHPELVRSLVLMSTWRGRTPTSRSAARVLSAGCRTRPGERAFLEAFFLWVYTPRAHADGTVEQIIEEALAFPHQQSTEAFQAQLDAFLSTTRPTAWRRSPRRRWSWPARST